MSTETKPRYAAVRSMTREVDWYISDAKLPGIIAEVTGQDLAERIARLLNASERYPNNIEGGRDPDEDQRNPEK